MQQQNKGAITMTHAVIFQSAPYLGVIRQTLVVGDSGRSVFTRFGAGNRGSAGAWRQVGKFDIDWNANEFLVGQPVGIEVTDKDTLDLSVGVIPSNLLQKAVRKVVGYKAVTHGALAKDTYEMFLTTEASEFSNWKKNAMPIQVQVAPQPVVQPVAPTPVVAPAPVAVLEPEAESNVSRETLTHALLTLEHPTLTDPDVACYVPRSIFGTTEEQAYRFAWASGEVVAIDGHAGTGKTSSSRWIASVLGLPYLRQETHSGISTKQTQGGYVPTGHGNELQWVDSPLVKAIQQPSVVLINELTRTSAKNASLFLGLLNERQLILDEHLGEIINVHPQCLLIADYNSGYRGTSAIDQALFDRFNHKWKFTWSEEAEAKRVPSASFREFLKQMRADAEREDKFSTPVSTRLALNFVKQAQGLSLAYAIGTFLNAFPSEEQDAIKMHLGAYLSTIATDLGVSADVGNALN
jgi:MoxR-like ATPase